MSLEPLMAHLSPSKAWQVMRNLLSFAGKDSMPLTFSGTCLQLFTSLLIYCSQWRKKLIYMIYCFILFSFTNIVVRWPGSTHDSFILANSFLPQIMRGVNGWFLGDSGYPLKKWLLTPFAQPSNQQEQRYNSSHCSTRNTVERAFGVLKSRFRYLS